MSSCILVHYLSFDASGSGLAFGKIIRWKILGHSVSSFIQGGSSTRDWQSEIPGAAFTSTINLGRHNTGCSCKLESSCIIHTARKSFVLRTLYPTERAKSERSKMGLSHTFLQTLVRSPDPAHCVASTIVPDEQSRMYGTRELVIPL